MKSLLISILLGLLLIPALTLADHRDPDTPFCGDGVITGDEKCIYDQPIVKQCLKEGAKIPSFDHYPVGESCLRYDRTSNDPGETGVCIMSGVCWVSGEKYKDVDSRIVVIDKAVGLEQPILIYIYDPGRAIMRGYRGDAWVRELLEGPDHYLSNFCNGQTPCVHNNDKGSSLIGDRYGKWNGYVKNSQPGPLIRVNDFSNWFEAEPSDEEKQHWYQTRLDANPYLSIFAFKKPGKYQLTIIDTRGNRVESEPFIVCNASACEPTEIRGGIRDGHGLFVPDMKVILSQETKTHEDLEFTTHTDDEGQYYFNEIIDKNRPVRLTFAFEGKPDENDKDRFLIYDKLAGSESVLDSASRPVFATTKFLEIDELPVTFDFRLDLDLIESANIGDKEQLDDFARIHYFVAKAMQFAEERLNTVMHDPEPLRIHGNNTARNISFYSGYNHAFFLSQEDTKWDHYDKPDNAEWHEITHAIMHAANLGGKNQFPEPRHPYGEFNHLGYANPGTTDSWVEGFAVFLSSVMSKELEYEGSEGDEPWIYRYGHLATIHMDDNIKVWDNLGRKEDMAVATLLWDIYDDPSFYGGRDDETISLSIDEMWTLLNGAEIRDVKDIYDAFLQKVPQKKLDEIFISHGVYFDKNGNRKYDDGEVVGTAANGGAFFTDFDFEKDGYDIYDVNIPVGSWLLGGTKRKAAPTTASDDVPRWGTADADGDGDIATLILSPDGESYESAVIDKDGDGDFGLLTDLDGDGKGEMTEAPFWVMPFNARRSTVEFPEEMLQLNILDQDGNQVAESYILLTYEHEKPYEYRNYQSRNLASGNENISLWVPEQAILTIKAEAGKYASNEQTITHQEFFNKLQPRSDQGSLSLIIPASQSQIAQAIEDEKKTSLITPSGESSGTKADNKGGVLWGILFVLVLSGFGYYLYRRRRR